MKRLLILFLLVALFTTGCYRVTPKTPPPLGTNIKSNITVDGSMNLTGNLNFDLVNEFAVNPTAVRVSPINPPQGQVINSVVFVYSFDRNNLESLYASWHTLPRHKTGSNITYELQYYWAPDDASAGVVVWCVQPLQLTPNSGDTLIDPLWPPMCVNATAPGTAYEFVSATIPNVTIPYVSPNDEFMYAIFRDAGSTADTYNDDAHLVEFNVRYHGTKLGDLP